MTSPASPRLPSPPPIAEDQLSPVPASPEQQKFFSNLDHAGARRIRPGSKADDMAEGPPLVDLSEIDSAFQLTEHLKALHNFLTHPIGSNSMIAVDKDMAFKLAQPPDNVDKTLWLYELCRFLTQKVNSIIVALFSDHPACSSTTCPEMRASEWQYLCAVHDPPKSCCAIDYCCHTLDWAANTLTSPKHFPSRLALGTDQSTQHSQIRQLTNIFRRVYRIFAHAWFQHRDMFWKIEGRTGLYIFFKTVCDVYGLIPEDNYTIPPEAEGIEPPVESRSSVPPLILKREPSEPRSQEAEFASAMDGLTEHTLSTAGTTKRHRHSPSVGAMSVTTVVEEAEEEEDQSAKELPRPVTQLSDPVSKDIDPTQSEEADTTIEEVEVEAETETSNEPVSAAADVADVEDGPEKQGVPEEEEGERKEEGIKEEQGGVDATVPETQEASGEAPVEEKAATENDTASTEEAQSLEPAPEPEAKPDAEEVDTVAEKDAAEATTTKDAQTAESTESTEAVAGAKDEAKDSKDKESGP